MRNHEKDFRHSGFFVFAHFRDSFEFERRHSQRFASFADLALENFPRESTNPPDSLQFRFILVFRVVRDQIDFILIEIIRRRVRDDNDDFPMPTPRNSLRRSDPTFELRSIGHRLGASLPYKARKSISDRDHFGSGVLFGPGRERGHEHFA